MRSDEVRSTLTESSSESAPWIERSYEARLLTRLLDAALATETGAASRVEIAASGEWFQPPEGDVVLIETRGPLLRLLARLAAEHRARPGRGLSVDDLFEAAWPGETRTRADSRQSRVYVAVSTLRKLGLRDVLARRADGYRLDPVACVVTDRKRPAPERRRNS